MFKRQPPRKTETPPELERFLEGLQQGQATPPTSPADIGQMAVEARVKPAGKTREAEFKPDEARLIKAIVLALEGHSRLAVGELVDPREPPEVTPEMARTYLDARREYEEGVRSVREAKAGGRPYAELTSQAENTPFFKGRKELMEHTLRTWGREVFDRYFKSYDKSLPLEEQSTMVRLRMSKSVQESFAKLAG